MRDDVGIVGVSLFYPDHTVQHAGVVVGFGGIAGHTFIGKPMGDTGYMFRLVATQDYSAVTAACLMVKKSLFDEVGGLTEEFKVAFNDIDFCMKVRETNHLVVYTPHVKFYHYESKSRGLEDTPEKVERFGREIREFQNRWGEILEKGDPYYNPNLRLDRSDFAIRID
jgi:GT2 family glycosyltransferase